MWNKIYIIHSYAFQIERNNVKNPISLFFKINDIRFHFDMKFIHALKQTRLQPCNGL